MELEQLSMYCGVKLRVLPDFLLDHTLLHYDFAERLPEHCGRWVQFVQRLWAWRDNATFCLRFDGRPMEGSVGIYLLAKPSSPQLREKLQRDLEFALTAYGILNDASDSQKCLPLLTPEQVRSAAANDGTRLELRQEICREFGRVLQPDLDQRSAFVAVTQEITSNLWFNKGILDEIVADRRLRLAPNLVPHGGPQSPLQAWIPLSWDGPSGSFLLPFKALLASSSSIQLSIYLRPCTIELHERLWLEKIGALARKSREDMDPAAELASMQCTAMARRLLNHAFMVSVHCVAADGNEEAVVSVANSIQSLCTNRRPASTEQLDISIPGARITVASREQKQVAINNHVKLEFPRWTDLPAMEEPLKRLLYLTDASGAATVFRLPVSVRGGVPGVEVEQAPPDFNPGPRSDRQEPIYRPSRQYRPTKKKKTILIGKFESAGYAHVDVDDFTKHALVTGFTGSGKTKTILHLLHQFWADHRIPFMVIESAKAEYRGLIDVPAFTNRTPANEPELLIYTLGNESVAPFRINPFELLPGVRVESHVNRLQTCFEAALPPFAPLVSIIEQSIIDIYRELGWMMTDIGVRHAELGDRRYPVMSDFAAKLAAVGESRGYEGENKATLMAAIRGRIRPLTRAMHNSKGRMLDTATTWPPPAQLFGQPTILELNDLNEQDKALVAMFLLTLLREYREQDKSRPSGETKLRHITVVEEAHNVLENVHSVGGGEGAGADTRYKAVQAFCGMLTEIRALGEGLIIADQSPEKLAPDAMRNTNIQIAHQLRDGRDRFAVANAMIMTDEQREYLGKLKPGAAAVFYTGLQRASFVKIPQFDNAEDSNGGGRGAKYREVVSDEQVMEHMRSLTDSIRDPDRPFEGCKSCGHIKTCDFRWPSHSLIKEGGDDLKASFKAVLSKDAPVPTKVERFAALIADQLPARGRAEIVDASWCLALHLTHTYFPNIEDGKLRWLFDQVSTVGVGKNANAD